MFSKKHRCFVAAAVVCAALLCLTQDCLAEDEKAKPKEEKTGEEAKKAEEKKLSTVIKSKLTPEAKAAANAAKLKMPLKFELQLPKKGWLYKGTHKTDGDGPLGKMRIAAEANLIIPPAKKWPVDATLDFKPTKAAIVTLDGKWVEQPEKDLPPRALLPPVAMAPTGRAEGNYNPGEAPLSFIGDLWPLPLEPLDIGDCFQERVTAKMEPKDPFRIKGVRRIKLLGTKVVNSFPCALLEAKTNLEVKSTEPDDKSALKVVISSKITFDTTTGWPLAVEQKAEWSGKVDVGGGKTQDFKWQMSWNLKRAGVPDAKSVAEAKKAKPEEKAGEKRK